MQVTLSNSLVLKAAFQLQLNQEHRHTNLASAPCPCVVDGIMIATVATPGQSSLRVAPTPSEPETFGTVEIKNRRTGQVLRYKIPASAQTWLDQWNQDATGRERYDAVMNTPETDLFSVEVLP